MTRRHLNNNKVDLVGMVDNMDIVDNVNMVDSIDIMNMQKAFGYL